MKDIQAASFSTPSLAICELYGIVCHVKYALADVGQLSSPVPPHDLAKFGGAQSELNFSGVLFHAQQSFDSTVPGSDLYPAGHALHDRAAVAFENVSAAHATHAAEPGAALNEPCGQASHAELLVLLRACP
jgi:hypothetical protein